MKPRQHGRGEQHWCNPACTVAARSVTCHLRCRAPGCHKKCRQGHRLSRRASQTEQGQQQDAPPINCNITDTRQGLRSKLETTTNAEGDDELKKLISVSLRPDDPFAKRLLSTPVRTNNLLLKVTVPKRTGRKRRRGTSGPFLAEDQLGSNDHRLSNSSTCPSQAYVDAPTIYKTLQDNASTYKVTLAGVVDETHRFRSKPY